MSQKTKPIRRKVWPTAELPHIWAHQKAPEGRNPQGNLYFEGPVIYSYGKHFPIAKLLTHNGKTVVLMTVQTYGNVTAQHLYQVRNAVDHMRVFNVGDPVGTNIWKDYQSRANDAWQEVLERPRAKISQITSYDGIRADANRYAQFIGLKSRIDRPADYNQQFRIGAKFDDATRARQEARRRAKAEHQRVVDEVIKKRLVEIIPAWREGKLSTSNLPHHLIGTMLRLVRHNRFIESSKGVFVPVADAPAIWEKIKKCRHDCVSWQRNGNPDELKVGGYTVDEVHQDGEVVVGCHRLPYSELESIAKQLGYSNEGNLVIIPAESPAKNPAQ